MPWKLLQPRPGAREREMERQINDGEEIRLSREQCAHFVGFSILIDFTRVSYMLNVRVLNHMQNRIVNTTNDAVPVFCRERPRHPSDLIPYFRVLRFSKGKRTS